MLYLQKCKISIFFVIFAQLLFGKMCYFSKKKIIFASCCDSDIIN